MDEETKIRFDKQDVLLSKIFKSSEKTRKYFLATLIITVVTLVLPLIALVVILPWFMNTYINSLSGFDFLI